MYHSSGAPSVLSDEEIQREARRSAARRGIQIVGRMSLIFAVLIGGV